MERALPEGQVSKVSAPSPLLSYLEDPLAAGDSKHLVYLFEQGRDRYRSTEDISSRLLHISNLSADAEEFTPQNYNAEVFSIPTTLTDFMDYVTFNPGSFDSLVSSFLETFRHHLHNTNTVQRMAHLIFDHSVTTENFRYHGAKLCSLIDKECSRAKSTSFMDSLSCLWKNKVLEAKNLVQNNPINICGTILFMAELFVQLHSDTHSVGVGILQIIQILLQMPLKITIKAVCQVLKLAGHSLTLVDEVAVNYVIKQLHQHSIIFTDEILKDLVNSVTELHKAGWGVRADGIDLEGSAAEIQETCLQNEPVLYGPDGTILTAEEERFLKENANDDYSDDGASDDIICVSEDHMDEEMENAYEEFLQLSDKT